MPPCRRLPLNRGPDHWAADLHPIAFLYLFICFLEPFCERCYLQFCWGQIRLIQGNILGADSPEAVTWPSSVGLLPWCASMQAPILAV